METQVVVVGAGPVGLLLAGELRLAGVDVVVLERLSEPTGESRASVLHARTMEILDQRGLLDLLGTPPRGRTGHFGGLPLDLGGLPSSHPGQWSVPQFRTEELLTAWASALGADIRRGTELRALTEVGDTDGDASGGAVDVEAVGPSGTVRLRASYVVGCDGEHSTVRQAAGFDFPGACASRELLRADVAGLALPDRRFQRYEHGLANAARRESGVTRVMVHEFGSPAVERTGQPSFAEVAKAWSRVTGEDISGGAPVWVDAFDDTRRQVSRYRRGRVLLAGDAAHRQMPIGGQGLNLGLQDAMNLGWKLAGQVRGWAPSGLLDSYHEERHPVGERVLADIGAQALLLLGDERVDPVRAVLRELLELGSVPERLGRAISGLDIRYDVPRERGHETTPGAAALLGARVPPCPLETEAGPTTTTALLRPGFGVLLDLTGGPRAEPSALCAAAGPWADRVCALTAAAPGGELAGTDAVLVRPDGHVAWVGTGGDDDPRTALRRWFGGPDTPAGRAESGRQPRAPRGQP